MVKPRINKVSRHWVVSFPILPDRVAYFDSWVEAMKYVVSGRVRQLRYA